MPDSDTPIQDALDHAYRRRRSLDDPEPQRSPEELAAERRRQAEARLERAGSARERKEMVKHYSRAKGILTNVVTGGMKHGQKITADELEAIVRDTVKDLGANAKAELIIREFVADASDAVEGGDKTAGWKAAEAAAEQLVNDAGWKPPAPEVEDLDGLGPRELAERISRDRG